MEWIALALVLATSPVGQKASCKASVFGTPGDRWVGGDAFCLGRRVNATDVGVAHRTLKCGTPLLLTNPRTRKRTIAVVVDRGPYGALDEAGTWFVRRTSTEGGQWRGCLDLTPKAAELLGHNGGLERIEYRVIRTRNK